MRIIDTHCHPQFPQFDADRDAVIRRALDGGVGMVCVGTDYEMSQKAVELAERHDGIWASVGLHPNDNLSERYDQELYEELAGHPKVAAIGEVGLDYYRTTDAAKLKFQRERFEQQLELATRLAKPVIIHCRDGSAPLTTSAHADMLEILSRYKLTGVIHSFTGTYADATKYTDLGFFIGLNGIITFARDYDDTVVHTPLERILLETDAPYLTPEPHRGKRNEPAYVTYVAEQVARLRRMPVEEVMEQTTGNAKKLFRIA